MRSDNEQKSVLFQSIRPAQCRCTDKEVCRHCKGKRRSTPWEQAVRENNRKYIEAKGERK